MRWTKDSPVLAAVEASHLPRLWALLREVALLSAVVASTAAATTRCSTGVIAANAELASTARSVKVVVVSIEVILLRLQLHTAVLVIETLRFGVRGSRATIVPFVDGPGRALLPVIADVLGIPVIGTVAAGLHDGQRGSRWGMVWKV